MGNDYKNIIHVTATARRLGHHEWKNYDLEKVHRGDVFRVPNTDVYYAFSIGILPESHRTRDPEKVQELARERLRAAIPVKDPTVEELTMEYSQEVSASY